jgi:ribosomal-protein-alanine N-acetyltransferase
VKARFVGAAARAVERGRSVFLTIKDDPREDFRGFEIRRVSDGAVVGSIEISRIARGNFQSAYLGYRIGAADRGQGYMTEALELALRHSFRALRLHRVEANIEPGNEASIALVRRAGFTREGFSRRYLKLGGRWRDHERWALLREDWRPARRSG